MSRLLGILALTLAAHPAAAFHTASQGIDAAVAAQKAMTGNPPLPMLRWKQGTWKVTLKPALFSGEPESNPQSAASFTTTGDFKGWGGGVGASYAFRDRWGVYVWGLGAKVNEADFAFTEYANCGGGGCTDTRATGVTSSFTLMSVGVVRQFFGEVDGGFSLPVFAGPALSRAKISQTIKITQAGTVQDDFDMEVDGTQFGFLVGTQAGFDLGKAFRVNPFAMAIVPLGDACATYDVTAIRTNGSENTASTPECGGMTATPPRAATTTRQIEIADGDVQASLGINVEYVPWGVAFNITAPFLKDALGGGNVALLTLSWSFGDYVR